MFHDFEAGFSLLELLVSVVLMLLVLIALHQTVVTGQRIFTTQEELAATSQQARVAMDTISRCVRRAGSNPLDTVFHFNTDPDELPIPLAEANAIQILADLPQDVMNDAGNLTPDGDTMDSNDLDGNNIWDDDENEHGDGLLNDPEEDVTFYLSPADANLNPTGSGPWILVKRIPDGGGGVIDIPLAPNVMQLEFRYILKIDDAGDPNRDTLPLSFSDRWNNAAGAAINASDYSGNDRRFIYRVLVRLIVRSANPDRTTKQFHNVTLQEDIGIRSRS
jgi:type II secretory pathway pseudopilin PulG